MGKGNTRRRLIFVFALIAVFLIAPAVLPLYRVSLLTEVIIFSLYAISYNFLLGYAGLLSFGHALFFGTGGYLAALLVNHIPGISLWGVVFVSAIITAAIGLLIGGLLLRQKGAYFALLTLAFNYLFYAIATKWYSVTGGDDGLSLSRPSLDFGVFTISLSSPVAFYYFTFITLGLLIAYCWYFTHTAMGQTIVLIRENEERMKFVGYNPHVTRLILFVFTGTLAGVAGTFYALHFEFVSVNAVSIDMTTAVLLMTFIGGMSTFWGPILGAAVYIHLQDFLSDLTDRWPLIMGLIFVLMVLYMPQGLSGLCFFLKDRVRGMVFCKNIKPFGFRNVSAQIGCKQNERIS
ncbi:branched-chain amino acid transport system permease protein [Thermodesulforhabdus norvegica]|uniref:Branched-chain amino acid transport system permease protein n=2 Tax=Thermodesulforhabdus norvegica TaxID=39841 RepID=A0A1I4W348_9BACT|nr:branched-chain amino acid transport system permease protein [Thermodesulforhabdus norvegica]